MNVYYSTTAIDILPWGVDKLVTIRGIIGDEFMVYFGDSDNDLTSMVDSDLWIVPGNAGDSFKENIKNNARLSYIAKGYELRGTIEGLDFLLSQID